MVATVDIDTDRFNEVLADFDGMLRSRGLYAGRGLPDLMKYQGGQLARTLINITPPREKAKSQQAIQKKVSGRFAVLNNPERLFQQGTGGKHGSGDVYWYAWNSTQLYGVMRDSDMTKASVEDLYQLYLKTTYRGTVKLGMRGKQKVRVWQKILAKKATVNKLIKRIQSHLGRQKAGWLPAWRKCGAPGAVVPQWITRHEQGVRGRAELRMTGEEFSVTFYNSAVGIVKSQKLVASALKIRVTAMVKDIGLYVRGIKRKWTI
jgi:hypothetical protein